MANYGIVRTDNMHGTVFGADLVSVRYAPSNTKTAIENGSFAVPGAYETGSREVRLGDTPAANTALDSLVLIASEEVVKDKKYNSLGQFRNEAGAIARGYKLNKGDMFSLTKDAFTTALSSISVGAVLEANASAKAVVVSSATANVTTIATLVAIETEGDNTWYCFRV